MYKKHPIQTIVFFLALGSGVITLLLLISLWNEYYDDIDVARNNSSHITELMSANTNRYIGELSDILLGIKVATGLSNSDLTSGLDRSSFDVIAANILEKKPYIRTIFITSPNGTIKNWNRSDTPPSIYDRDYVQYHRNNPGSGFNISPPIKSKLNDEWILVASTSVLSKKNELESILAISISHDFFSFNLLQSPTPGGYNLSILTDQAQVIWSEGKATGYTFPPTIRNWIKTLEQSKTETRVMTGADGKVYLVGTHYLGKYPIIVASTVQITEVLKDWYSQLIITIISIITLLTLSIIVGRHLIRNQNQLFQQHEELKNLAMSDPMTGLANRRCLKEQTTNLMASAKRHKFSIGVLMLDIDHFKQVNDTYGHDVGDNVIKAIADSIKNTARDTDITCRLGGEEFAIILSHSTSKQALIFADRLRERIKTLSFESERGFFGITISMGVSVLDNNLDEALTKADKALYLAKNNGRDQVVLADDV